MAIGLVLNNWGCFGGAWRYHVRLIQSLQSLGHTVKIALPYALRESDKLPKDVEFFKGMEASIKALQSCSTWIVWGIGTQTPLPKLLERKRTAPKVIVINHGAADNRWSIQSMAEESPYAYRVVCASSDGFGSIPPKYRHKATVIEPPIDRNYLQPVSSRKVMQKHLGLNDDNKVLLHLGRIAPEKRIERIIEAARYLPSEWRVLFVGNSQYKIDPALLFDNFQIQFCGPTHTIGNYLQLADCAISTSASEGFGLSVIESISCGVPTVAHKVGILKCLNVGTIVDIDCTPQRYAAAVVEASKNSGKAFQDQDSILNMFSIESFTSKWSSLL